MLRHLAASWFFAGFLVVVAVATWRVLDARDAPPPQIAAGAATNAGDLMPVVEPAAPVAVTPTTTSCGAAHDPFDAARAAPPDVDARHVTTLQLGTQPFADVVIDGEPMGSTPFYGPRHLTVHVGAHVVALHDKLSNRWFRYRLTILKDDPDNKVIIVLNDHNDGPRLTGAVQIARLDDGMAEDLAQKTFSEAVDAFRERRNERACHLLEDIIDRGPEKSRWVEKSENLRARRCD